MTGPPDATAAATEGTDLDLWMIVEISVLRKKNILTTQFLEGIHLVDYLQKVKTILICNADDIVNLKGKP